MIDSVADNDNWLTIGISSLWNDGIYTVNFWSFYSYRNLEEWSVLIDLNDVEFEKGWYFYRFDESEYLDWFQKISCGIRGKVYHYAIYAFNDYIDVITSISAEDGWSFSQLDKK